MSLARILVDGYSLLHGWPELAPGRPRHSAAARAELIRMLASYRDAIRTPVTVVFDGAGAPAGTPNAESSPELEIIYSKPGQTADDIIERAAHRLGSYGEVLVVTDDFAERETVLALGGSVSGCLNFIRDIEQALAELREEMKRHNSRERGRFQRAR